ncbi:MAG TPA: T9SS type A sorting domain-containing protein [Chitinophagaceae bacterium]|jgi:uncharacterized delta-60 repeat protein
MRPKIILPVSWLLCNAGLTFAQPGTLDPAFSANGKVITNIGVAPDQDIEAIALQSDGKIVAVGNLYDFNRFNYNEIAIVRYNSHGRLDKSFGDEGIIIPTLPSDDNVVWDVKIQADGKILLAGTSYAGPKSDFLLLRYNNDGTPDKSFGNNGIVRTDFENSYDFVYTMAIQKDGKIVVAGGGKNGKNCALARYNKNGTLDPAFGDNGKVTTVVNGNVGAFAISVAILPDGKIIIADRITSNTGSYDFALVRYKPNGAVDKTFGTLGRVFTDIADSDDFPSSMAVQSDGKILVCGTIRPDETRFQIALVRYNKNGTLDKTFNGNGKVITNTDKTADDEASAVALQPDGKIIVAGRNSHSDFVVIRFTTDGSKDKSFGNNGLAKAHFIYSSYATSIALQKDGKIVAGGYVFEDFSEFALARFNGDNVSETLSTQSDITINTNSQIKIYPNPVGDYIHVTGLDITAPATISIIDNTGKALQKISNANNTVTVKMLPPGIYYLLIDQKGKRSSLKFEKQ